MTYEKLLNLTRQNLSANFDGITEKNKKMNSVLEKRKFDFKITNSTTATDVELALLIGRVF
jgi:hypothetical protein